MSYAECVLSCQLELSSSPILQVSKIMHVVVRALGVLVTCFEQHHASVIGIFVWFFGYAETLLNVPAVLLPMYPPFVNETPECLTLQQHSPHCHLAKACVNARASRQSN